MITRHGRAAATPRRGRPAWLWPLLALAAGALAAGAGCSAESGGSPRSLTPAGSAAGPSAMAPPERPQEAHQYVLPPGKEAQIEQLLGPHSRGQRLPGGYRLRGIQIAPQTVTCSFGGDRGSFALVLGRPTELAAGLRSQHFSIRLSDPADLLSSAEERELTAYLSGLVRQHDTGPDPWIRTSDTDDGSRPTAGARDRTGAWGQPPVFVAAAWGLLLLGFAGERRSPRTRRLLGWLLIAGAAGLAVYAVLPLMTAPFANDAPVLRAAYAYEDILGDWNHPFLPYLLNRPATWLSLEPWAVRAVPLLWLLAEVGLLTWLGTRLGGLTAGALGGIWFVCELPRRESLDQVTDWDLAGALLLGLTWWMAQARSQPAKSSPAPAAQGAVKPHRSPDLGRLILLLALLAAGFFSSFMMIVPAAGAVAVLWLYPGARGRVAGAATALLILLSLKAGAVFQAGGSVAPLIREPEALYDQMLYQLPLSREIWLAPLLAGGICWLIQSWRRPAAGLMIACLVGFPVAIVVAWRWSHVNGGYYLCLITPLLLLASAVPLARLIAQLRARGSSWLQGAPATVGLGALLLGVGYVTIWLPPYDRTHRFQPSGMEHVAAFDELLQQDQRPVVSCSYHLPLYLAYDRARRGVPVGGPMLPPYGPRDLMARLHRMDSSCRVEGGFQPLGDRFWLVTEPDPGTAQPLECLAKLPLACRRLFPPRPWLSFYDCRPR